ncbi:MAG: dihydroorotate dehydrogenase electron transfer subunit [Lachnospiraceae bacterium]|nr:dihydroorotate dehydrogenase electron transfer subunit [Lachnospiraceae bacterium]
MSLSMIDGKILSNEAISSDCYSMMISVSDIASLAVPGQFVNIYVNNESKLLPRPISICEVDAYKGTIRLVYRAVGAGTKELSSYLEGTVIKLLGPLGNGYELLNGKKAMLIGGGIGIPPLLELAKRLDADKSVVLGFRDEIFLADEFKDYADVYIASEDGKTGVKGNVIDAIREYKLDAEVIYACGPTPMLRAIKEYGLSNNMIVQLSLEERMACGIGACLACVCKTANVDDHSFVNNSRVCKDGPVFRAEEVVL